MIEKFRPWCYQEIWKVTEWRDGHVYKTKLLGVVKFETGEEPFIKTKEIIVSPLSTNNMVRRGEKAGIPVTIFKA